MIRYNNILRPVTTPLRPPHDPPAQNLGVATPQPIERVFEYYEY